MSVWTYVEGFIEFSSKIEKDQLGYTASCDDSDDWDRVNVPCGSEGSIIIIESKDSQNFFYISGDLRDYSTPQNVYKYFDAVLERSLVLNDEGTQSKSLPEIKRMGFVVRVQSDFEVFFIAILGHLNCCSEYGYREYSKI